MFRRLGRSWRLLRVFPVPSTAASCIVVTNSCSNSSTATSFRSSPIQPAPYHSRIPWVHSLSPNLTSDMSSHRLFRFPKPAWLNSPNTRTAGVYFAGALVISILLLRMLLVVYKLIRLPVFTRFLLLHRCLNLLSLCKERQRSSYQICGLDTGNMFGAWDACHQFDRED